MSNRKAIDLDVLGETHLPDDLFTNTDGLNWMLDTFPDLGKGMGVLDHETLGDSKEPPALPDGVVMADELTLGEDQILFGSLIDMDEVLKEGALSDLSWLEFAEQDPERLPDNPVDNGISELEEAWGVNRRTDGISFLPNVDRESATYEESLTAEAAGPTASDTAAVLDVVRQASRKVAAGASFKDVAVEAAQRLGAHAHLARGGMTRVKDDAGLIGRVFVRASDYPGCASGTWTEAVRKQATTATYVVQKKACGGCVHAQDGSCSVFKKKLVASVPWDDALRRYGPALEATGRKVASGQDPKEALRRAFAKAPVKVGPAGDVRPQHLVAADQVGDEEARKAFAEAPAALRQVLNASASEARAHVARWKGQGLLTADQAQRLTASTAAPPEVLRTAARLIAATKQGAYSGGLNAGKMGYAADEATVLRELAQAEHRAAQANALIVEEQARRERAASHAGKRVAAVERKAAAVMKQIDLGLRGKALVAHILRSFEAADRGLAASILDPYIAKKGALAEPDFRAGAYTGLANDTRVADVEAVAAWDRLKAAHVPAPVDLAERRRAQEHRKVLGTLGRWVRDGLLPKEAAARLASSDADARDVLRVAAALVGRGRVAQYSGVSNDGRVAEVAPAEAWAMLTAAEDRVKRSSAAVSAEADKRLHAASRAGKRQAAVQEKVAKVVTAIDRGLRGQPLMNLIRKLVARDEVAEVSALLDPILRRTGALEAKASDPRNYEGAQFERAPTEAPKAASGPAYGETERLVRWARQQMSEGFAGEELDQLLSNRFAFSVRTAAASVIHKLRSAHEGLSGHAYVDAEAYASRTGTAGCEKGALRHRANQVPAVLTMPRCATCSLRVAKADGTPVCSMYNKVLVASAAEAVEDPRAYQAEMLRLSNGTDADRTAALFSNAYDPGEFNLGEDGELDHLVVADAPSNDDVGDIFFGGMEVE